MVFRAKMLMMSLPRAKTLEGASIALQDPKDRQVRSDDLGHVVILVLKASQECLVKTEILEVQVNLAQAAHQDHLVHQDLQVKRDVMLNIQLDDQDPKEIEAHPDLLAQMVIRVKMLHKAKLEFQDQPEGQDRKDHLVDQDLKATKGLKDARAKMRSTALVLHVTPLAVMVMLPVLVMVVLEVEQVEMVGLPVHNIRVQVGPTEDELRSTLLIRLKILCICKLIESKNYYSVNKIE